MRLRPPGEVEPQISELQLSDSASDSSVGSILDACQDGLTETLGCWMQKERTTTFRQVTNDPCDIPWSTTVWRAGAEDQGGKQGRCAARQNSPI